MYMIVNTTEGNHFSAKFRAFRGNCTMDALLKGAREQGHPIPGGPDRMDVDSDAYASHDIPPQLSS